jgi:hypothetical protein
MLCFIFFSVFCHTFVRCSNATATVTLTVLFSFRCCWRRWVVEAMLVIVVLTGARAVVSTLAGGISGTTGAYADASGTNAGFKFPYDVAVDASGNVFVADSNNHRIRKITPGGGTQIGPVTLCALAAWTWTWQRRRERAGRFSHRRSPTSHSVFVFCRGSRYCFRALVFLLFLRCFVSLLRDSRMRQRR